MTPEESDQLARGALILAHLELIHTGLTICSELSSSSLIRELLETARPPINTVKDLVINTNEISATRPTEASADSNARSTEA